MKHIILCILCIMLCIIAFPLVSYAHSGGTDSNGGHYNHSTGGYHYHHGYSAHSHYDIDGDGRKDCPYEFKGTSKPNSNSSTNSSSSTAKKDKPIIIKILYVIGYSILAGLVGVCSGILIILYFVLMLPVEAIIKRCYDEDSQESATAKAGTVVKVIMAITIVVVVAIVII